MNNKKKTAIICALLMAATMMNSCTPKNNSSEAPSSSEGKTAINGTSETGVPSEEVTVLKSTLESHTGVYNEKHIAAKWDAASPTITFVGSSAIVSDNSADVNGSVVTITQAGTYILSGEISDGQIIVDITSDENVQLVMNGVDLTCKNSAPIYAKNAKNLILTLADGTVNNISDNSEYIFENETITEPDSAIFSECDLIINGGGTLNVNANYRDGIASKDDLTIIDGIINVKAADDGIRGKDSVCIRTGNITVESEGDGIKATNIEDTAKGYIIVDGGDISIVSGGDSFDAENLLIINDGTITTESNGGSANASVKTGDRDMKFGDWNKTSETSGTSETTVSAKALKSTMGIEINGGKITIDSSDDSIHSNQDIKIKGGTIDMASGDDGMHADDTLTILGGTINITKSYEGIEAKYITVDGGDIRLAASDDGFNVSGGNDGSSMGGRMGQNSFSVEGAGSLTINGGDIYVNADGDGLDSNGAIYINGGTTIVEGPTNNGNGPMDYTSACEIKGGTLLAAGSSGMMQTATDGSTQITISSAFSDVSAGSKLSIQDSKGNELYSMTTSKTIQSVVFSSPEMVNGETYSILADGTELESITADSIINGTSGFGGFGGGGKWDFNGDMPTPPDGEMGGRPGGGRGQKREQATT